MKIGTLKIAIYMYMHFSSCVIVKNIKVTFHMNRFMSESKTIPLTTVPPQLNLVERWHKSLAL